MDGSGSIGYNEFQKGKRAVKCIMKLDDPTKVDARYAAVTFSTSATVNFQFIKQSSALNAIMQIPFPDGWTNTQAGLAEAKKLFEDPKSGALCRILVRISISQCRKCRKHYALDCKERNKKVNQIYLSGDKLPLLSP